VLGPLPVEARRGKCNRALTGPKPTPPPPPPPHRGPSRCQNSSLMHAQAVLRNAHLRLGLEQQLLRPKRGNGNCLRCNTFRCRKTCFQRPRALGQEDVSIYGASLVDCIIRNLILTISSLWAKRAIMAVMMGNPIF
jgi:hypothetical protein